MKLIDFVLKICLILLLSIMTASLAQSLSAKELTRDAVAKIETKAETLSQIWDGEEIRRSISLFKEASQKWRQLDEFNNSANCLIKTAELNLQISTYDDALDNLNLAKNLFKKTSNKNGLAIAKILISRVYQILGKPAEADKHLQDATNNLDSLNSYSRAYVNYLAGRNYYDTAQFPAALKHLRKAHESVKSTNQKVLESKISIHMGSINATLGNKADGIKQINDAIEVLKQTGDTRNLAMAYNRLGFLYVITGDKQKSIDYYYKAKEMFPVDVDYDEQAIHYSGIGTFHMELGQLDLAEQNFRSAISKLKAAKNELGQGLVMHNLAQTLFLQGKVKESIGLLTEALKISEDVKNYYLKAIVLQEFGVIDLAEGRFDEAIKKLRLAEKAIYATTVKLPHIKNRLGKAFEKKNDIETARNYYQQALAENRANNSILGAGESLYNLALLNFNSGDIELALEQSSESVAITESIDQDVSSQVVSKSFISNSFEKFELNLRILMHLHKQMPEKNFDLRALEVSERARARLMRENLRFADANISFDANKNDMAEKDEISDKINEKKLELLLLSDKKKSGNDVVNLENELSDLENEFSRIQAKINRTSPIYSAITNNKKFLIEDFQREVLDDETVLIELFFGQKESYLWLIEKNRIETVKLPAAEILNKKIENLISLLIPKESSSDQTIAEIQQQQIENETQFQKKSKALSQILFGKIINKLGRKRILFVPDGKLRYFPISALPNPEIEDFTPLLLTNEISLQPSASLLYLIKHNFKINLLEKDLLVISDPVYSTKDKRMNDDLQFFRSTKEFFSDTKVYRSDPVQFNPETYDTLQNLERLDAAREETKWIFNYFDESSSTVLKDFEANRENLLNQNLEKYKVLHFATHGIFNEEYPELSGIVLSKFDSDENGLNAFVWLADIYKLNLSADLVVLSACDTAIGVDIKGEGLQSLTNGFLQVGAKSVISSHWKVEDEATLELMKNFYEYLASDKDITASKALQKAKMKMFKNEKYRSPYFWASFTFHGDFDVRPDLAKKSNLKFYLLILLTFALLLAVIIITKSKIAKYYFTSKG